jgi:hypothetical protein
MASVQMASVQKMIEQLRAARTNRELEYIASVLRPRDIDRLRAALIIGHHPNP